MCGGGDFFKVDVPDCDYIISNPPYSIKTDVFERLYEIGKPFAMLTSSLGLFESQKRFNLFCDKKFEIMYFDKRVSYIPEYDDPLSVTNPPFTSVYLCMGMLPDKVVFERIDKKDN